MKINNMSLKNENKNQKNYKIIKENNSNNDIIYLINELINFELNLRSLNDINDILNKKNLEFFKTLCLKENIRINLLLSKIYTNIISKDFLYNQYLISIEEKDIQKIEILLQFIEDSISLIEKLDNFVLSSEIFVFKKKIIDLIKCIYYNCKGKIKNDEILGNLLNLIEILPTKFFSNSFLELSQSKEIFEIYKNKETEKIIDFEEKFSKINNYYEQFEIFKMLIETNSNLVNYNSIDEESTNKINENDDYKIKDKEIPFLINFGAFILKFCKYHNYMFLNEEMIINEEKQDIDKDNEEDEENQGTRITFSFDKSDFKEKTGHEGQEERIIEDLLNNKKFVSSLDSKVYEELIIKEIKFYLKLTQNIDKVHRIKIVREHLAYYLSTLKEESYYPLYLKDLTKITINDGFTPYFAIKVGAGSVEKFYFETPENEDALVLIEFSLEDKSKDINFALNKYEIKFNKFISLFKDEKIQNTFKFFVFSHGYSLYEIVFDNYYSWFNSKEINYKISLLKLRKENEIKYDYMINGTNYYLNINEEKNKKENTKEDVLNVFVILDKNNMNFVSFKKNKNSEEELIYEEHKEKDEKIISKDLFDNLIINYLKLNIKEKTKQKIIISIFSQNRDLLLVSKDIKEKLKNTSNIENKKYIKNIGFIPENNIDGYNLEYKLYTRNEQILIYHMFLTITKNIQISKSILIIEFDKYIANAAIYSKGEILNYLDEKNINFNNINIDNIDQILYLIKYSNNNFEKLEIILSSKNNDTENDDKKLNDSFEKIQKYCQEIINPPLKIYKYEFDNICKNSIKYINLLYSN